HAHAFSIAPVQLSRGLFDLEMLGRERTARWNDGRHVSTVEIRTDDGAVVRLEISHVRPVDMSRGDIDRQAVRELAAFLDDRPEIGAVGVGRQYAVTAQIEEENTAGGVFFGLRRLCFRGCCGHVSDLPRVDFWVMEVCCLPWRGAPG